MLTLDQIKAMQARLAPYYTGEIDGRIGPKTYAALYCLAAGRTLPDAAQRGAAAAVQFPKAQINTPLRIAHFLAQCAHESGGFRYTHEIWGPTPAQARYDTRTDLGNTPAADGDGKRYMGRADIEITGRANYAAAGKALGLDLIGHPEIAEAPENCIRIAIWFWTVKNLNRKADGNDIVGITRAINGGLNGIDDRLARLRVLSKALGV